MAECLRFAFDGETEEKLPFDGHADESGGANECTGTFLALGNSRVARERLPPFFLPLYRAPNIVFGEPKVLR